MANQMHAFKKMRPEPETFKAAFIERFNRTLQSLIQKYLIENATLSFHNHLQDFMQTYNNR